MKNVSRRSVLQVGAGIGAATLGVAVAGSSAMASPRADNSSLDQLYADAVQEDGRLVVYAGGDVSSQLDGTVAAFRARFPKVPITIVVDWSKYHDVRIDNQFATGSLVPDVVQLQTVQDFDRWKKQGQLLPYRPLGFSNVHPAFRDPSGAWVAHTVIGFSYSYDTAAVGSAPPRSARELVHPRFKDRIASSYPNDDDAVLYLFKLYAEAYGWDWVARLATQNIQFARGTHVPGQIVAGGGKAIAVGIAGSLAAPASAPVRFAAPDGEPFMAWGQRAAIFRAARNPAAAKLYMSWQLSPEVQRNAFNGWSVRTDVRPSALKPIWHYRNAHLGGFPAFMADRAEVERWRQTFTLYFGEVTGAPTPGWLGLHPGR